MAIKFLSNESIDGTLEVGTFTVSGSGIVAAVGMTLQVDAGSVNAITIDNVGTVTTSGYLKIPNYLFHDGNTDTFLQFGTDTITLRGDSGITLDGPVTTNAAFNLTGGIITLGVADTSSGHINAYENLTFNIDIDNDDTNRYFGFYTNGSDGSGTELVRIAEDGNVAIQPGGATLTNTRLYVVSADNYDPSLYDGMGGIRIGSGGSSSAGDGNYTGGIGFAITSGTSGIAGVQKGADADKQGLAFFTHPSDTGGDAAVEKMRLDADGNVGIGTNSPQENLEIHDATMSTISLSYEGGSGNGSSIDFNLRPSSAIASPLTSQIKATDDGAYRQNISFSTKTSGTASSGQTTRMTILGDGNVGIGSSTNPQALLDVNKTSSTIYDPLQDLGQRSDTATIHITNQDTTIGSFGQIMYDSDGSNQGIARIVFVDSGTASVDTAFVNEHNNTKAERMRITSDGNVGIGTDSPSAKLHIYGGASGATVSGNSNLLAIETNGNNGIQFLNPAANNANINFGDPNNNENGFIQYQHSVDAMRFRAGGTTILNLVGGNVGIGTASPGAKLVIATAAGANTQLRLERADGAETGQIYMDTSDDLNIRNTGGSGDIILYPHETTGNTIVKNGNVGIGTTAPQDILNLHTSSASGNIGMKITRGTETHGLRLGVNDSHAFLWTTEAQNLVFATSGIQRISILSGGNVGIGDTTPSYKLDVAGTIRATGDVIAYSDVRVKENIKTIDNSLEKVSKLRGVEFNKIGKDEKSIGVIAQEIEKVIPEVVHEDKDGMKSVAYGNITGVLIEAIKELKAEIEGLKNKPCACNNCNCKE